MKSFVRPFALAPSLAVLAVTSTVVLGASIAAASAAEPSTEAAALAVWDGAWEDRGTLPLEPRIGASVAIAHGLRQRITIWGGRAPSRELLTDGFQLDPADPAMTTAIPAAPISGRTDHGWAGRDGAVYVWGGVDAEGAPLGDGAAFESEWLTLPEAPLPAGPASMTIVEDRLWVVATDTGGGGAVVSSLRVPLREGDSWTAPMAVPVAPGARYEVAGCCAEEAMRLFVFSLGDRLGEAAVYDIPAEEWTEVGPVPIPPLPADGPAIGRALEDDLATWVGVDPVDSSDGAAEGTAAVVLSLREPWKPWTVTEPIAADASGTNGPVLLGPSHVVDVGTMLAYDLVEHEWLRVPDRGADHRSPVAAAWWDDGKAWVLDGPDADEPGSRLWSLTPAPPAGAHRLPSGTKPSTEAKPCVLFGKEGTWRLRGNPRDADLVWLQRGKRRAYIDWPDGWFARFDPRLRIVDSAGVVRYRAGDRCPAVTGTGG